MFEEDISEVIEDQPESGQSDIETAEQDTPTELPDDKDALKQTALELQEKLKEKSKESARQQRENERLKQSAEEQRTKADYWSREAQRKQAETATDKAPDKPARPSSEATVKAALGKMDLAEYVALDNGVEKLVGDLEAAGVIVTTNRLEEILDKRLDERVTRERTQTQAETRAYREVVGRYPDLEDPESELAVEAASEFEKLADRKDINDATKFELAAARAATAIGYKAQPKTKQPTPITTQGRLRGAQRSTTPGGGARQPVAVQITESERKAARQMGQTEKEAIEAKRGVLARQQKRAS